MSLSWKVSLQTQTPISDVNQSVAKETLWAAVSAFRQAGFKTEATLDRLALMCGLSRRKIACIAYDEPCRLSAEDIRRLRFGRIAAMRWMVDYHKNLAEHWKAIADYQEGIALGQQQFRDIRQWGKVRVNTK